MLVALHTLILFGAIVLGARMGSIAIGFAGGIGGAASRRNRYAGHRRCNSV